MVSLQVQQLAEHPDRPAWPVPVFMQGASGPTQPAKPGSTAAEQVRAPLTPRLHIMHSYTGGSAS